MLLANQNSQGHGLSEKMHKGYLLRSWGGGGGGGGDAKVYYTVLEILYLNIAYKMNFLLYVHRVQNDNKEYCSCFL